MWFQKKVKKVEPIYPSPIHTNTRIQVARIHFYLPNDVIILPIIIDWYAPYGPVPKDYRYSFLQLFNSALNNHTVREGWLLFNGNYYPETSIRYIEITDINKLYVKEI